MKEKFTIKKMFEAAVQEVKAISVKTALSVILVLVLTAFAINTCALKLKIDNLENKNNQNAKTSQELEKENKDLNDNIDEKNKIIEQQKQELSKKDDIIKDKDSEIKNQTEKNDALIGEIAEQIENIEIQKSAGSRSEASINSIKNSFSELENTIRDTLGYSKQGNILVEKLNTKAAEYQDTLDRYPDYRPTVGNITSPFGYRIHPVTGEIKFHKGVDLDNVTGTAIWASAKGVVVSADYDGAYGYSIVVDHENGFQTRYAHLSEMIARVGKEVEKGELIGRMGATGLVTGDHLHFEVMIDGERVNPMDYIPK